MKRILKSPVLNAVCISLFTVFYAAVFFIGFDSKALNNSAFLSSGIHLYIAGVLIIVTAAVVILLLTRRHSYDEYHTSILIYCLAAAAVLTLVAITVFYLLILFNPAGITEKFTIFIIIHWAAVVFSDLVYVLICRWR